MTQNIVPTIDYPSAFSNWLNVYLNFSEQNKELAVCGGKTFDYLATLHQTYLPNIVIAGASKNSKLPFLEDRFSETETLFYLCQNKTCGLPTTDFEEIISKITIKS